MSAESVIYGSIVHFGVPRHPVAGQCYELNQKVIESLPVDVLPGSYEMAQSFFTVPMPRPWGFYRSQVIHFGASYNHLEDYWSQWLASFESLLKRLYWHEARLHLDSEYFDRQEYLWRADARCVLHTPPSPISSWEFEGGLSDLST
jgi:hypothetical protein